jgi:hypothetical protein
MDGKENTGLPLPGYAFWDVKPEKLDQSKDKGFIISRMFERGKYDDVLSVIVFYGIDETARALQNNKFLNRQGLYLAHTLLGLPLQDFKAYGTLKHH